MDLEFIKNILLDLRADWKRREAILTTLIDRLNTI